MKQSDSTITHGRLGRTALVVHGIALAAIVISIVALIFAGHAREETQFLFAFGGVAVASYLVLSIWSLVLAVQSLRARENPLLASVILFSGAIQAFLVVASVS